MFMHVVNAWADKGPDTGDAFALLTYYYAPLAGASLPVQRATLRPLFAATDLAHQGRRNRSLALLDETAGARSLSPRDSVLVILLKAHIEADADRRVDGSYPDFSDTDLELKHRQATSTRLRADFLEKSRSPGVFTSDAVVALQAYDALLERCLRRNVLELRHKAESAVLQQGANQTVSPTQGELLNQIAAPMIDACVTEFDQLLDAAPATATLPAATRAAVRLEIIAGQAGAATLHGRLDPAHDDLQDVAEIFSETGEAVAKVRDPCTSAWLRLRFVQFEMRPFGASITFGLDLPFEMDQLANSVGWSSGRAMPALFEYGDPAMPLRMLDDASRMLSSCRNAGALGLAVEQALTQLALPRAGPASKAAASPDTAPAKLRELARKASQAGDLRTALMADQMSEALSGDLAGFPGRLSAALAGGDPGLAITLADLAAAMAARRMTDAEDYTTSMHLLEQVQDGLRLAGLPYHSTVALRALTSIFSRYMQRLAMAATLTEYVHRVDQYLTCDKDEHFSENGACDWPDPDYRPGLRQELYVVAYVRLAMMGALALDALSEPWAKKISATRTALSRSPDFSASARDDLGLRGISEFVETVMTLERSLSCAQRLKAADNLLAGLHWTDAWTHALPLPATVEVIERNRAFFVHCDRTADQAFRARLAAFDVNAAIDKARAKETNGIAPAGVDDIVTQFDLASSAGYFDLIAAWLDMLKANPSAARVFRELLPYRVDIAQTPEAAGTQLADARQYVQAAVSAREVGLVHDRLLTMAELMVAANQPSSSLEWLETADAYRTARYDTIMGLDRASPEGFERVALERRLAFDESLPDADWSRLRALRLTRPSPRNLRVDTPPHGTFEHIGERLPAGTVAVRFYISQSEAVAFVLQAGQPVRAVRLTRDVNPLFVGLEHFVRALALGEDAWRQDARWAYDSLIKPLELPRDTVRLVIVPGDFLAAVPFEVLPDEAGSDMGGRYQIVYANRLWRGRAAAMPRISADLPGLFVGTNVDGLVYAEDEAHEAAQMFRTAQWLNTADASRDLVQARLQGAQVVHFATHGYVDSVDPFRSALTLGHREDAPLWWLVAQSLKPRLLVLSACRTAQAAPIYARRAIPTFFTVDDSLASIAEFLDIPYVIATLWPVADEASRDLMLDFYRSLLGDADGDPITALHQAKSLRFGHGPVSASTTSTLASFRVIVPSLEDILR
jgi:CHAT domain-containing protein